MGSRVENVGQGSTTVTMNAGLGSLDFIPLEMGRLCGEEFCQRQIQEFLSAFVDC